jgi:hypothetical protein
VPSARTELDHTRIAVAVGVVDEEEVVALVVRAERDREEAALAAARDARRDVEQGAGDAAAEVVLDAPGLLHDVEAVRLPGSRGEVRRALEAGCVRLEVRLW